MAYNARTIHELVFGSPNSEEDELIFWDTSAGIAAKVLFKDAFVDVFPSVVKELVPFSYSDIDGSPAGMVLWWPTVDFVLTDVDLIVTSQWVTSTATCMSLGNGLLIGGVATPQQYLSQLQCSAAKLTTQNSVISGFHNVHSLALISGGKRHYMTGGTEPLSNEDSSRYIKIVSDGEWAAGEAIVCIRGYYLS